MIHDPNRPPATGPEWNGSRASDVPVEPGGTPNPLEAKKSNDDPPFDFAPPEDILIDDDVCVDEWMAEAPDEPPTGNGHDPDPADAGTLEPDREMLLQFAELMFKNANPDGFVSLRAFLDNDRRDEKPILIEAIRIGDADFAAILFERARQAAAWDDPAVFCPPVATFKNHRNAKTDNLLEGVDLSAECDQGPQAARSTLETLLGTATVVVESGGEWINPATGEIEPKVHLHWRLKKPTLTKAEHDLLKEARTLAANLVGGDDTNKSVVHPIRWPGSWHRKKTPRLAKIVASSGNEIDLNDALEILREASGTAAFTGFGFDFNKTGGKKLEAVDHAAVASALSVIPNGTDPKVHDWEYWNWIGMATWAATGGSEIGRVAFHEWSAKSPKNNKETTESRWQHYKTSPPTKIGFGTLVYLARQHDPTFCGWDDDGHGAGVFDHLLRKGEDADADTGVKGQSQPSGSDDEPWDETDPEVDAEAEANPEAEAKARPNGPTPKPKPSTQQQGGNWNARRDKGITLDDFYAYMPRHTYIFVPTREMWPGSSVNTRLPRVPLFKKSGDPVVDEEGNQKHSTPSAWLDKHRPVEQMTWAPGEPLIISNRLIAEGGWIERQGVATFNMYRPPAVPQGNAANADRWIELMQRVYPNDANHIIAYCAHRIQYPAVKINHGILLGGSTGIGKDTLLEPLKLGVGAWNFKEVSPQDIMDKYNDYMTCVVLRISEAHDLGDINRYAFHDHMKTILAAPPDVIRVNGKYLPQYYVQNVAGVFYTTNNRFDSIYLPPNDRRTYVAWSELLSGDFVDDFWASFWAWYNAGGLEDVVAYLTEHDLSHFDPKAPPKKTEAFWQIVGTGASPENAELADVLDELGAKEKATDADGNPCGPVVVTIAQVLGALSTEQYEWWSDRKNRRGIPHKFEACGYTPVRNTVAKDGLWVVRGKRQVVYGRMDVAPADRIKAAEKLPSK